MHRFANPARFQRLADALLPWLGWGPWLRSASVWLGPGLRAGDYQQATACGSSISTCRRPGLALFVYVVIAAASGVALVWRHPLAHLAARAGLADRGLLRLLDLVTGSLWGKAMWGTWWEWDGRLTSMLVLFFLYLGHLA